MFFFFSFLQRKHYVMKEKKWIFKQWLRQRDQRQKQKNRKKIKTPFSWTFKLSTQLWELFLNSIQERKVWKTQLYNRIATCYNWVRVQIRDRSTASMLDAVRSSNRLLNEWPLNLLATSIHAQIYWLNPISHRVIFEGPQKPAHHLFDIEIYCNWVVWFICLF